MPNRKSLRRKIFTMIFFQSVFLVLVISGISFVMNVISTMQSYKRETAHDMRFAVSLIDADYLESFYKKVWDTYSSIPEEIKKDPFSQDYTDCLMQLVDEDFWKAREILVKCREESELDSVSLIMTDPETDRIIFVVDGYDIDSAYLPGQWISEEITNIDTPDEIKQIIESETKMFLDYGKLNGWIATNYTKITDRNGNFMGYMSSDINITDFVNRMLINLVIYFVLLIAVVFAMAWTMARLTHERMIAPINTLALTAQQYTRRDKAILEDEQQKDYFEGLSLRTGDEIETLWSSLSNMEKDIDDTMHRIREMTAEKEKVEAELGVATKIQAGMLPKKFPAFPGRNEFEVYASMDPAKEVGGDLYDFFLIDNDHLCLVVGDVSGKGVPASLFMVVAITAIRNIASTVKNIPEIMQRVNYQMCKNNEESLFVTVWLGIYCISEKKLRFSNAGHEYPAIYRASKNCYELYDTEHDIPMGIMEDIDFSEDEITLEKGDKLFIYTDGVPEATRGDDALFDTERMLKCLNDNADKDGKGTLDAMTESVNEFIEGAPQFDDLTMLYFEVKQ